MSTNKFTTMSFPVSTLIGNIQSGQIGLPELQRPFVWDRAQVRDLIDSLYRGYPAGHFLFWQTQSDLATRPIGLDGKTTAPNVVVVDGQQRLTSLYAVFTKTSVLTKDFKEQAIRIAFNPLKEQFDVASASTDNDPEYVSDVSDLLSGDANSFAFITEFLAKLRTERDVTPESESQVADSLGRLNALKGYNFNAIQLSSDLPVDEVSEIFVRVNSKGTPLNQADFILTLMSVYWDEGRRQLEDFSRASHEPSVGSASPFNWFLEPSPDQMLRVAIGLGHRRAQLKYAYELLRGKDLESGVVSDEVREKNFGLLQAAQSDVLDLTNWSEYLKCLQEAGYRSGRMITSNNAILYSYLIFLIGRKDFGLDFTTLRTTIARWFAMVMLTSRYTGSPESQVEKDLRRFAEAKSGDEFVGLINQLVQANLTDDFWTLTLPDQLAYSGGYLPAWFAYVAALNLLDAKVLFSKLSVHDLLDPAVKSKKSAVDRHHLFPKGYLKTLGLTSTARTNQAANYALVEWPTNIAIGDAAPSSYFADLWASRVPAEKQEQTQFLHALPDGWEAMEYDKFLDHRRRLMAKVVRAAFEKLATGLDPVNDAVVTDPLLGVGELIAVGETLNIEFKSSIAHSYREGVPEGPLRLSVLKTIAAFLNTEGGTLAIGLDDGGTVLGIEPDLELKNLDRDGYENMLSSLIISAIDNLAVHRCRIRFETVAGKVVCLVDVSASPKPVYVKTEKGAGKFFVRVNNTTREYDTKETVDYIADRWGLGNR